MVKNKILILPVETKFYFLVKGVDSQSKNQ